MTEDYNSYTFPSSTEGGYVTPSGGTSAEPCGWTYGPIKDYCKCGKTCPTCGKEYEPLVDVAPYTYPNITPWYPQYPYTVWFSNTVGGTVDGSCTLTFSS